MEIQLVKNGALIGRKVKAGMPHILQYPKELPQYTSVIERRQQRRSSHQSQDQETSQLRRGVVQRKQTSTVGEQTRREWGQQKRLFDRRQKLDYVLVNSTVGAISGSLMNDRNKTTVVCSPASD